MKEIPLSNGMIALVDDEDHEWLSQRRWGLTPNKKGSGYATRKAGTKTVYMHRLIMSAPTGTLVDHIDHNTLNNVRSNLRLVTAAENSRHRQKPRWINGIATSSVYKGVARNKRAQLWHATISIDDKTINLGRFQDEIDAAHAYDAAAKDYFGAFAILNFTGE